MRLRYDRWSGKDAGSTLPARPRNEETRMPSKIRRTSLTLKAKSYRTAVAVAGLLVMLEALGAPRKL